MPASCCHYWVLDAKSFGTCKYCGETKQFDAGDEALAVWRKSEDKESLFTESEISKAQEAGVELKTKSKKELKRRRHNPDSTLKKVKCTYPGCTLGPDGGPYECDPRALHLHIQLQHGVRKHRTPKRIVHRVLELFDAGTPQVEILAALKSQNNFALTSE